MSVTGIHCTVDKMGRIVLPAQVRHMLAIRADHLLTFVLNEEKEEIVVRPVIQSCLFCNSKENLIEHRGREVCTECVTRLTGC